MDKRKTTLILLFFAMFLLPIPMEADKYKVLYTNSDNIRIDDRPVTVGMEFEDVNYINWLSDSQAMKVLNLSTNRIMVVTAQGFKRKKAMSLEEYFLSSKHLSTRGYGNMEFLTDTIYYMLDTLTISAGVDIRDNVLDEAVIKIGDDWINIKLSKTTNKQDVIITRSIFSHTSASSIYIDIVEEDEKTGWRYYLYRNLYIKLLPLHAE